jgi:hypothetical protein
LITLGINVVGECAYLAVVQTGEVLDVQPYTLEGSAGLPPGRQLVALRNEARKVLTTHSVARVRILAAEAKYKATYFSLAPRLRVETLIALAAAEREVGCARISRPQVRSSLGLPRAGTLSSLVGAVCSPVGSHWGNRRDLAALAALAGYREEG